jgi:hypothetical protein
MIGGLHAYLAHISYVMLKLEFHLTLDIIFIIPCIGCIIQVIKPLRVRCTPCSLDLNLCRLGKHLSIGLEKVHHISLKFASTWNCLINEKCQSVLL